jgi:hypothetical protein
MLWEPGRRSRCTTGSEREVEMKRTLLAAAVVAVVVPAGALAKEVTKLDVCGAAGCTSITDRAVLDNLGEGANGETYAATPALQPYYRLVYTVDAEGDTFTFTNYFVPGAKVTRGISQSGYTTWYPASPNFAETIARVGGEPLATPTIDWVKVGSRRVADPQSYTRLLTIRSRNRDYVDTGDWRRIVFHTSSPSPWSSDGTIAAFSGRKAALERDGGFVHLSKGLAKRIAARRSLSSGSGFGGHIITAAAIGAAAAALAAAAVARRRRR